MFINPISELPNTRWNKRTKQKRTRNSFTVTSRDFSTPFSVIDRTIKQKISTVMGDLDHQLKLLIFTENHSPQEATTSKMHME